MVNEELKENEENISPTIQNYKNAQILRRERAPISIGSAVLKASVCAKQQNPLISKQCTTEEGQTVPKAQ